MLCVKSPEQALKGRANQARCFKLLYSLVSRLQTARERVQLPQQRGMLDHFNGRAQITARSDTIANACPLWQDCPASLHQL